MGSRSSKRKRHFEKANASKPSARWRSGPPTERQLQVLRRIEREIGRPVPSDLTAAQAYDLIAQRFAANDAAARAHRRAERKRRRESPGTTSSRRQEERARARRSWRFGASQTREQELAEIRTARRLGLEREYSEAQRRAAGGR